MGESSRRRRELDIRGGNREIKEKKKVQKTLEDYDDKPKTNNSNKE